jgi:hypothetical protein
MKKIYTKDLRIECLAAAKEEGLQLRKEWILTQMAEANKSFPHL